MTTKYHGLDTADRICFYEQEFYPLSNFSAFSIYWPVGGIETKFDTSEALYHWWKFPDSPGIRQMIREAPSAHDAFKLAERFRNQRRPDWDAVKVDIMRSILRAKLEQHEYVRHKLLETGDRELVENSWRDSFWGWGPNRDGQNWLGKLWMELRAELRVAKMDVTTPVEALREKPVRPRGLLCRYCGCTLVGAAEVSLGSGVYDRLCHERDGDMCETRPHE